MGQNESSLNSKGKDGTDGSKYINSKDKDSTDGSTQHTNSKGKDGTDRSTKYTLEDVKKHNTKEDMWIIIEDKVFDVSDYLSEHPGGDVVLIEVAGTDATTSFKDVGHTEDAEYFLSEMKIGEIVRGDEKL